MAITARGHIPVPDLDDRRWEDLVAEARALIPRYAPQWTDHSPSDIGITLIELFAWLVEGLIFRLNQVPDKHYAEFLELLGVRRDPPEPAETYLTFAAQPGGPVTVPKATRAQTKSSETEKPIVFETDESVRVLPTNLRSALFYSKAGGTGTYRNVSAGIARPGAAGVVGTIAPSAYSTLALGFDQPTTQEIVLEVELLRPLPVDPSIFVVWTHSSGPYLGLLTPLEDETNGLRNDGKVRLQLPATWSSQPAGATVGATPAAASDAEPGSYYWLYISVGNTTTKAVPLVVKHVLFNATPAHNALTVGPETLGSGSDAPFQRYVLSHGPLFRRPGTDTPYDHLQVTVGGTPWAAVDDLPPQAAQAYRLDPVGAELTFGDYDPATRPEGHGSIPTAPAAIVATTYRYVADGAGGNVGAGTLTVLSSPMAGISSVTNLAPAEGGADEESVEDAKRRAPEVLRNRYRAVTAEDYEYLAREASTEVGVVRCLTPRAHETASTSGGWVAGDPWTFGGIDRGPGNVNVIVVPKVGPVEDRPEPNRDLVQEVQSYLNRRHDLTSRLRVVGPRYVPIRVVIDATVWDRAIRQGLVASAAEVYNGIRARVKAFFHPVNGGPDGTGWEVGQNVFISDLYAAVMPDERQGFISALTIEAQVPLYHFPPIGAGGAWSPDERPPNHPVTAPGSWVRVADYELVCWGDTALPTVPKVAFT